MSVFLLEQGAEVRSQVHGAAVVANNFELTRILLDAGACKAPWRISGVADSCVSAMGYGGLYRTARFRHTSIH